MDSPVIVDKASEFGEPIDLDHPFPGFPFDDEGFGRRSDIRAHLDDLAARHPEFADHLLGPPWGDIPFQSSFRNRNHQQRGSGNGYQQQQQQQQQQQGYSDEDARSQASGSSATSGASVGSHGEPESGLNHDSEHTPKKNQIPQYGLRNTVDIGQHHHNMENPDKGNRGQRSMSAPPENRQSTSQQQPQQEQQTQQQPSGQRYVSRIDITPQHNQPQQHHQQHHQQQQQQQQPPQHNQPQQQQSQKPQSSQQKSNVRHIPIFVEGRCEPVLPRSFDEQSNFRREPSPTQFHAPPPHFQRSSPFGDVFAERHQWSPHFQDTFYQQPTSAFEHPSRRQQQQQPHSFQQPRKAQQQNYEQPKSQQKPRQQSPQAQQQQQEPPPKPKPTVPKDPLERVALIQKEIDSLAEQVKQYDGNSRTDKHYIYLDEMLTRELIKLDDIETEGRDNVRQARKNAIKTIQETIGLLESKAPLPWQQTASNEQEEQDKQLSTDVNNSEQITASMDIDQRPEDQVSNNDVEKTIATSTATTTVTTTATATATATTTTNTNTTDTTTNTTTGQPEITEADRKTTEIQSKEPIPLPPPCPSSEEKSEQSCTNDTDHRTLEMDVVPSQVPSEPMDTASAEKSKPTDSRQTASTEEKMVEVEKASNTVDESPKKPSDEAEQRKADTSEEEKKKEETENEKKSTQEEEQQRRKGDEKMEVDSEVKQSPKTQKKGKKTKKQQTTTASDKPIPLPAPESTATSDK